MNVLACFATEKNDVEAIIKVIDQVDTELENAAHNRASFSLKSFDGLRMRNRNRGSKERLSIADSNIFLYLFYGKRRSEGLQNSGNKLFVAWLLLLLFPLPSHCLVKPVHEVPSFSCFMPAGLNVGAVEFTAHTAQETAVHVVETESAEIIN